MVKVAMTGSDGFLGWHTRCALMETTAEVAHIPVGNLFDRAEATGAVSGASRFIHLAGVNRGTDAEVIEGNGRFAEQAAEILRRCEEPPSVVVYANSIQVDQRNTYGQAKAGAAEILADAAARVGAEFVDIKFPNLFGEHGRPFYNSVIATFCHLLARGEAPEIKEDRELTLLHAQDAADILLGTVPAASMAALTAASSVSGLLALLRGMADTYARGDIPDIAAPFQRNLFNTYRSFPTGTGNAVPLTRHADARGSFFEVIRTHGGTGQSSFSTTVPGVTRGDHFHRRKVERFAVLAGHGRISMRRCLSTEAFSFEIDGDAPIAIDMPTLWTHNITNIGADPLYTLFWTDDLFNPASPDTIPEPVNSCTRATR